MKNSSDGKKVINQTGCFPKDLDFNQICKSANKKNQLFGAYKILIGQDGNCYNKDGTENKNEANALCSTNFNNQLPKYFTPAPLYSTINTKTGYNTATPNYNTFMTKCAPSDSNFTAF